MSEGLIPQSGKIYEHIPVMLSLLSLNVKNQTDRFTFTIRNIVRQIF